ncbi:hypothetical protein ABW19_dt0200567 [Dactylella cylindrospora]|nr:hypothetical protein ABW19_dt0200567 [Dactylella cylindrospora]
MSSTGSTLTNFLSLPLELRLIIYDFYFSSITISIRPPLNATQLPERSLPVPRSLSILSTCRQIHDEILAYNLPFARPALDFKHIAHVLITLNRFPPPMVPQLPALRDPITGDMSPPVILWAYPRVHPTAALVKRIEVTISEFKLCPKGSSHSSSISYVDDALRLIPDLCLDTLTIHAETSVKRFRRSTLYESPSMIFRPIDRIVMRRDGWKEVIVKNLERPLLARHRRRVARGVFSLNERFELISGRWDKKIKERDGVHSGASSWIEYQVEEETEHEHSTHSRGEETGVDEGSQSKESNKPTAIIIRRGRGVDAKVKRLEPGSDVEGEAGTETESKDTLRDLVGGMEWQKILREMDLEVYGGILNNSIV